LIDFDIHRTGLIRSKNPVAMRYRKQRSHRVRANRCRCAPIPFTFTPRTKARKHRRINQPQRRAWRAKDPDGPLPLSTGFGKRSPVDRKVVGKPVAPLQVEVLEEKANGGLIRALRGFTSTSAVERRGNEIGKRVTKRAIGALGRCGQVTRWATGSRSSTA
jgi:hypothetical protein